MKERIEELVLKAIALDALETVRVGKANREGDWLFQYSEKFVELIVRECADYLDAFNRENHVEEGIGGTELKKHFGVE